jgi:hypothetical protein
MEEAIGDKKRICKTAGKDNFEDTSTEWKITLT